MHHQPRRTGGTVRIAHTSDWHLGRSFGEASLRADQEAFCDWFVDVVAGQGCDLVVIAGDIYDRAVAPTESIELFRNTVRRLLGTGATVVAITGNHDAADRVAPYSELLDHSGFVLRGGYDRLGSVVHHDAPDGPVDLVLLPFLHPQQAPDDLGVEPDGPGDPTADQLVQRRSGRSHESVLTDAVALVGPRRRNLRSLAVAHAFVTGGLESESERRLEVGGTGQVPVELFADFSYTALGHLHRPQDVPSELGSVRYSGTPLPYSFSEDHQKTISVVDMAADGTCSVEELPVPVGRRVQRIRGTLQELLEPGRFPEAHDAFVQATVTNRETVTEARAQLQGVYPHVVEVRLAPPVEAGAGTSAPSDIRSLSPLEAVEQFWLAAEGGPPVSAELELLTDVVRSAVEASGA